MLRNASHMLLEKQYSITEHFTAMRALAGDSKKLISYMDNFMSIESAKDNFIQTGNYTIDSILSMKFEKAQKEGIKLEHDIFIPSNLNIDYIDMTSILAGMLNCAIGDIMYSPDEDADRTGR